MGHILAYEGGLVNDPADPGGITAFGISKRSYPNLDIANLSKAEAIDIYRRDFWDPLKPLLLPPRVRLCVFDCAINQGLDRARKLFQTAVGVKADGVIGNQTLAAANSMNEMQILNHMIRLRLDHYLKIPTWPRYGGGWTRRLIAVIFSSVVQT